MFAHKEISQKVRRPIRSENARHLLVWVYHERCAHILYAFSAYYTQYLCWFCTAKTSLLPPSHHMPRAHQWKDRACVWEKKKDRRACVLRTWLRFATKRKKNEVGISNRAFPLESPSKNVSSLELTWAHGAYMSWGLRVPFRLVKSASKKSKNSVNQRVFL